MKIEGPESVKEEYDRYVQILENFKEQNYENVLDFHSKIKDQFPRISQLAFEILAIPGSSSDCESIASIAKNIWTERRNKMSPALLEAIVMEKVNEKFYKKIEQEEFESKTPIQEIVLSNCEFNDDVDIIENDIFENE